MKRVTLCGFIILIASVLRAQGCLYVQGSDGTLTVVPTEYVEDYIVSSEGVFVLLSTGKTLFISDGTSITDECPVEFPGFTFYRFNKKHNDQLFQSVAAPEEELHEDTIHISVAQIGKYLTATYQLTDADAAAWVGTVRQESKVTRQRMAEPVTYTLGHEEWRQLLITVDEAGNASYSYVPFGRQVTVCVDFLTDHPTDEYNVPRIDITTETGSVPLSKSTYIGATISIEGYGVYPDMPATDILIKGRGNSSWSNSAFSKNPYHFKFAEKQSPLGMTAGKHWVLLSNKQTGSMLCNALEQKASALVGCAAPCHIVPVELYINGSYRGSYNLTEKVGFKNNSVSLYDETYAAMLELDTYDDEPIWYFNSYGVCTKIHEPDFYENDSLLSISMYDVLFDWYDATNTLRYGDSEDYTGRFDVNYLVSYLFANELCYNSELQHAKSVFLYSENVIDDGFTLTGVDETPWIFGPMWDCDWSFGYQFGNSSYFVNCAETTYYTGWLRSKLDGFWYDLRFKSQSVNKAYYMLCHKFMTDGRLQELIDYVQDYYDYAAPSLKHNAKNVTNNRDATNYSTLSKRAAIWLRKRANFVYKKLKVYDIDEEPQPTLPTPCIIDSPDGMSFASASSEGEEVVYNLAGQRMGSPRKGINIINGRKVLR